ncbi:MAG: L-lactate dehydrogenase [Treponema sp.]|nr:L-lactate dehydrogenase [Candidatus Treponema scatequi]
MAQKVTIIGAGAVGSTIAYTLTTRGLATEVVLIDINNEKAMGEAMDIKQGLPFCPAVNIYAGSYSDAKNSEIVILTSGVARKPGQTRLDLAQTNVDITKTIIPQITKYAPDAKYIIVANPCDILTYQFYKTSGLNPNQIMGTGTLLDSARLRARIAEYYYLTQSNVHGYVFGEHGDSSFVPWSLANISGVPVSKYAESVEKKDDVFAPLDYADVENYMKKSGSKIIERKGATYYAIAASTCHLVDCVDNVMDSTLTVSSMLNGEYGIDDVCMSILCVVGPSGIKSHLVAPLTDEEIMKLKHSADCLKDVIKQLKF